MIHKSNLNLSVKQKSIIFLLSILLLFGLKNSAYSQTSIPSNGKLSTIVYENNDYGAIGYVYKKKFVEGQELTFIAKDKYDKEYLNMKDTILSGRYYCAADGTSYIDGFKKINYGERNSYIIKGKFLITNNKNEIGVTTNKKEGDKLTILIEDLAYYKAIYGNYSGYSIITLHKLPDNKYFLKINYENLTLETTIPFVVAKKDNSFDFDNYIEISKQVKLSFKNGDSFTGTVKRSTMRDYYYYIPDSGEYRYLTSEICRGKMAYSNYSGRFYVEEGITVFADGTIAKDDWFKQNNLTNEEIDGIYADNKSPTEMRNMYLSILEKNEKILLTEKIAVESKNKEITQNNRIIQNSLIKKYGDYWGNIIYKKEYTSGMTKEMVLEFTNDKYYKISKLIRDGNSIEIWEYNGQKMMAEIIKTNDKKLANDLLLFSHYESLGLVGKLESLFPTLVFSNGKLTDIYQN